LHDLESPAAAYEKKPFGQRQTSLKKRMADRLVDGVMSTDILTDDDQAPVRVEQPGCMQSPGTPEHSLR
jgi:hypothetical protein